MPEVVVKDLSQDVVSRLTERAQSHGSTLEEEVKSILTNAAGLDFPEFRQRAAEIRAQSRAPQQTDSVDLLREDRDR